MFERQSLTSDVDQAESVFLVVSDFHVFGRRVNFVNVAASKPFDDVVSPVAFSVAREQVVVAAENQIDAVSLEQGYPAGARLEAAFPTYIVRERRYVKENDLPFLFGGDQGALEPIC